MPKDHWLQLSRFTTLRGCWQRSKSGRCPAQWFVYIKRHELQFLWLCYLAGTSALIECDVAKQGPQILYITCSLGQTGQRKSSHSQLLFTFVSEGLSARTAGFMSLFKPVLLCLMHKHDINLQTMNQHTQSSAPLCKRKDSLWCGYCRVHHPKVTFERPPGGAITREEFLSVRKLPTFWPSERW